MIPRPEQHLANIARRYPVAWKLADQFQADKGKALPNWPDWCFLPAAAAYSIVSFALGRNHLSIEDKDALHDISVIIALAAWRLGKGVYRFDPELYTAVSETEMDRDLPSEVFYRLPELCIYVETPGAHYIDAEQYGFFAHLEWDANDSRTELRLLFDTARGLFPVPLHIGDWPLVEAVSRFLGETRRLGAPISDDQHIDIARNMAKVVSSAVSLVLYICTENADIGDGKGLPGRAMPVKTKRGERYFQAERIKVWDVGVRIGASIRAARAGDDRQRTGGERERSAPRAHIRRAHWHGFWSGAKNSESREFSLKWLPPIAVNVTTEQELPVTIHKIPGIE